jgi:hypothetical protein
MKEKNRIKINAKNNFQFLKILNGLLELTITERYVLGAFLDLHEKNPDRNPFSTESKKIVAKEIGKMNFNTLNNYIKIFKDKKLITKTDDGYSINPLIIRSKLIEIEIDG